MITEERVMATLANSNPVPDIENIDLLQVGSASYLATLEQRSGEVTQLETKKSEQKPTRRSWTPILVAAVAVVVLGVALVLINQGPEDVTVVTQPTPTTVFDVAPTTVPESLSAEMQDALAVAAAFLQARVDRDFQAFSENTIEGHLNGFVAGSLAMMPLEFEWMEAVGWTMEVGDCEIINADPSNTSIRCETTHSNSISEALGEGPFQGAHPIKIRFAGEDYFGTPISDTTVVETINMEFDSFEFVTGTWRPFLTWLAENHPDDVDVMLGLEIEPAVPPRILIVGERVPRLSGESMALWRQHTAEFIAELS